MTSTTKTAQKIEALIGRGTIVCRGWVLEGAGAARYGWYEQHPCKRVFLGRTLAEVEAKLMADARGR